MAFEKKLNTYVEEVSDNDLSNFSEFDLIARENNVFLTTLM